MTSREVLCLIALFAIATAAVKHEHPPAHHHHGNGHHGHDPIPTDLDAEVAPINVTPEQPLDNQEPIAEEDGSKNVEVEAQEENSIVEEVSEDARKSLKTIQEETVDEETTADPQKNVWIDCDYNVIPRISCHDCRTRVICKYPVGGKLVTCKNPLKPYCNNGMCSAVPTSGCA